MTIATHFIEQRKTDPLLLLDITHVGLTQPIRVVRDTQQLIHGGNTYEPVWFNFTQPGEFERRIPRANISLDRLSDDVVEWIDATRGAADAGFRFRNVVREAPDDILFEIELVSTSMTYDTVSIRAELGLVFRFNRPFCTKRFTPVTAPGLFI